MQYLDLDAVASNAEFTLKLNGKEHTLKVATVETFIQNMQDLEGLSMNASAADELKVAVAIVKRAFPTIPEKELRELNILQVKAIADFAQTANGEKVEKVSEDNEGNAPAAS
ncbi:hypothetical protein [Shinella zoogloeoides]|uniref:hypothetical protein n=1 Tax=Shinella zoogloeoides TaxID=352475 RepID=UPI00273F64E8|nr:hypothetical protein [Shinella zoogloeoides]WLR91002.1 hypothetical protein Q9316_00205 [Shinella zoogloeoides]